MNRFIVTVKISGGGEVSSEVEASNEDEAFAKGISLLKKNGFAKYMPFNPKLFSKVIPKLGTNIKRG